VPQQSLARANARLELARSAAFAAGPALGGALVAWAVRASVRVRDRAVDIGDTAVAAHPSVTARHGPQRHVLDELATAPGWWRDPLLRPVMWTAVVWNLAWFVLQAAYVPYAMRRLGLTAETVGFTLGCYGAGMLIGATLATRVTRALPFGMAVLLGPLMSVLAAAAMLPRCGGHCVAGGGRSCYSAPARWCGW
jgi:predicted MFS family arabinose efflux permease